MTFLHRHWDKKSPILLGYSGGPDSKALLYALYGAGIRPHVAHVDHGWRKESGEEAKKLKREIERLGLVFHTTRLSRKNSEEAARQARLEFFASLCNKEGCQAVLLAHQADDLAETVLKRILEGAHFTSSGGMQPISHWEDLAIWRPFLSVKKSELFSFLERKKLQPLFDPSCNDLRSKMRKEIFPVINHCFGKETVRNLVCFSERAYELKNYMERKCAQLPKLQGPWGTALFLKGTERVESRYLLHKFLPRGPLEKALDWIQEGKPNRKISPSIFIDRGTVFLLSSAEPQFSEIELSYGTYQSGDWKVEVTEAKEPFASDWKQVWSGQFFATFPAGNYVLRPIGIDRRIRSHWNQAKVPAFFREKVPVLFKNGNVEGEFLSGKKRFQESPFVKISFFYSPTISHPVK